MAEALSGANLWVPDENARSLVRPQDSLVPVWGDAAAAEVEEQSQGARLLEYWRIIFKHKWLIAITLALFMALGLAITLLSPKIYTASTIIEIDPVVASVTGFDSGKNASDYYVSDPQYYETQFGLLKSRSLAERVAQALGSDPTFLSALKGKSANASSTQSLAGYLQSGLEVEPEKESHLVKVSFASTSPAVAARVANSFADNFERSNLERRWQASADARNFLMGRIADTKAKLEDDERQLVAYATQQHIIDMGAGQAAQGNGAPGQSTTFSAPPQPIQLRDLGNLNDALDQAKASLILAQEKYKATVGSPGVGAPEVLGDATIENLRSQRAQLNAQYMNQLKIYKPDYPDMVQLKAQLTELDKQIASETQNVHDSLKTNYVAAQQSVNSLQSKVDSLKTSVLDERNQEIKYTELQREVDTTQTLYDGLLQRYKQIGIDGQATTNNVSVVDPAQAPRLPSSPRPVQNMAVASVAGLGVGVMLAFLLETLDQAVRKPSDVEAKLGLPVLGSVPFLEKGVLPLEALADQRSSFSEAYHSIRSNLAFTTKDGAPRILAVTSARPEEGKSTTAFALAQGFARTGMRVLLVDLDLRNPSQHKVIGSDNRVGASNLLTGSVRLEDAVQATQWPNLSVVPSGPLPPSPAELLIGPRLGSFTREASEHFDIVVLDCPPVMGLADAPLIASAATGTVLAIEAGRTSRAQAKGAIRRLRMADTHLVGAILTKFDSRRVAYGYGYAYAYEYEYDYQYGRRGQEVTKGKARSLPSEGLQPLE